MRTRIRTAAAAACLLAASQVCTGQEIQNSLSYRDIGSPRYFRFNYENDVFFGTDRYYTQGVHFELVSPGLGRSAIRRLVPGNNRGIRACGLGLESAGYSPTSITADSILRGDHPFAGLAYLKLFALSVDTQRGRRIAATLSLGWMGPSAGGYEIQSAIHRAVGSPEPAGWKYQLADQPVINYELNLEQELLGDRSWLRVAAWGMLRAGTLSTKAAIGAIAKAALPLHGSRAAAMYLHPGLNIVAYEAVLQGGPFTRGNPYVIAAADIRRVVASCIGGVTVRTGTLSLGAYLRWQGASFRGGADHMLGGLSIAVSF